MKNLSNDALANPVYKIPASEVVPSLKWVKWSLVVSTTLLTGLLPIPSNAQVSQERLELLSEQDQIAQQQLSQENEETAQQSILTPENTSIDAPSSLLIYETPSVDLNQQSSVLFNDDLTILQPEALTTYSANPQVGSSRCTSSVFDNYGCYAIEAQKGINSFNATASPFASPSASALNAQEANSLFFPNGNPPGTWLEAQRPLPLSGQPKTGFNEFAIGAAKVMNDWKSPVFFEAEFGFGQRENAVLESITFNSPYSNVLSSVCDPYGFSNKAANVSTVAATCAFQSGINSLNAQLTVSSIDIAYWPQSASSPQNRIDRNYTGSSLNSFISDNFNKATSTTYVWDPPETAQTVLENAQAVPEPSSVIGLLTLGLFGAVSFVKRKPIE